MPEEEEEMWSIGHCSGREIELALEVDALDECATGHCAGALAKVEDEAAACCACIGQPEGGVTCACAVEEGIEVAWPIILIDYEGRREGRRFVRSRMALAQRLLTEVQGRGC